jgi:glycerate 2-kinase
MMLQANLGPSRDKEPALLRAMLDAAVSAALPERIVPPHLPAPPKGRTIVLGAGKASAAMAKAVEDHWPGPLKGLVVTRYGHGVPCAQIEIVEASHPCQMLPVAMPPPASWSSPAVPVTTTSSSA